MRELVSFESLFAQPLRNGVSYPAAKRGNGVPLINMREIFAYDRVGDVDCELAPLTDNEKRNYLLNPGDLLFARQSLTYEGAGKCSIVLPAPGPRTWESHLIRVRLNEALAVPGFYYYFFKSRAGRQAMEGIIQQVAASGIRGSDLRRLEVPAPPLGEQRAIAEVLGALDDKIAANSSVAETAHELARAVYEHQTEGVALESLGAVLNPILGGTPSRSRDDYWHGDMRWVSARDVTSAGSGVILETEEHITDAAVAQTKAKPLPKGSVILTARGTVGAVARLGAPASFNQSCYGFSPGELPASVLYFVVRSGAEQAKAYVHGSVFDTITMRTFEFLTMPDLDDEQVKQLETQLAPLLDTATSVLAENRCLAATRDALLPGLMSGKIRVKDAQRAVEEVV